MDTRGGIETLTYISSALGEPYPRVQDEAMALVPC